MSLVSFLLPVLLVPVTMNILKWLEKKIKRQRKQQKAAAKAQRKAEKKLKQGKDSAGARLEEQRASQQVRGQEKEPRPTPEMHSRAQEEAAQRDDKAIREMLHGLAKSLEKLRQQSMSPASDLLSDSISSSSSHEPEENGAAKEMSQDQGDSMNEAMVQEMTAKKKLENIPHLEAVSSGSSCSALEEAAKNRTAKARSQEPTSVQKMSPDMSPLQHVSSASSLGSDVKKPLQSSEKWKEPGKEQSQAGIQREEPGKEQSQASIQQEEPGKKQSKASTQQQQPEPAAPCPCERREQGRAQEPSSARQKLQMQLARIWLHLKGWWIGC